MVRAADRQVTKQAPVDTRLGEVRRGEVARTTRALGSTRVEGWVANNSHTLAGLRALSQGLDDAMRATEKVADRQKQEDIEKGEKAFVAGATYEDQNSRGLQEGYLKAKGRNAALGITNDLHSLYDRGQVTLPDGTTFNWKKGAESWEDASSKFLMTRMKGLDPTEDSMYFLSGLQPLVEQTIGNLSTKANREASQEWASARHQDLRGGFSSAFQMLREVNPEWAPSRLEGETDADYSKRKTQAWKDVAATQWQQIRGEIVANYVATGGSFKDINDVEYKALNDAVMSAAASGDDETVNRLLSLGNVKRGDLKLSLAESGYGADLVDLEYKAVQRMNANDRDAERIGEKTRKDDQDNAFLEMSLRISDAKKDPEALKAIRAEWDSMSRSDRIELFGNRVIALAAEFESQDAPDAKDDPAGEYYVELSLGKTDGMKERVLADAKVPHREKARILSMLKDIEDRPIPVKADDLTLQNGIKRYSEYLTATYRSDKEAIQGMQREFKDELVVRLKQAQPQLEAATPGEKDAILSKLMTDLLTARGVKDPKIKSASEAASGAVKVAKPEMSYEELKEIPNWQNEIMTALFESQDSRGTSLTFSVGGKPRSQKMRFNAAVYASLDPAAKKVINQHIALKQVQDRTREAREFASSGWASRFFMFGTPLSDPTLGEPVEFVGVGEVEDAAAPSDPAWINKESIKHGLNKFNPRNRDLLRRY